jgi:hypothetical protein
MGVKSGFKLPEIPGWIVRRSKKVILAGVTVA